jgi:hypothetical protein
MEEPLRLELQGPAKLTLAEQPAIASACERDLARSWSLAQLFNRLRHDERIRRDLTFGEFVAIAEAVRFEGIRE